MEWRLALQERVVYERVPGQLGEGNQNRRAAEADASTGPPASSFLPYLELRVQCPRGRAPPIPENSNQRGCEEGSCKEAKECKEAKD